MHHGYMFSVAPTCVSLLFALCNWSSGAYASALGGAQLEDCRDVSCILTDQTWTNGTTIAFPGTLGFFNATERWTTISSPSFNGVISPINEEELVKIVKLVSDKQIPFLATGGRHGYTTTYGRLQNGLAIDLSHFTNFQLNQTARTVTVGPGIHVGDVLDPLYDAGFAIQTGSSPCPSLIGVSLGGGIGRYQGVYGLISDALVHVRMVTASGEVIEASKESNPDLFWAVRGAGSNFGIITSATYEIHPLIDDGDVFVGEFLVPANRSSEFFGVLEAMSPFPAKLSSIVIVGSDTATNQTHLQVQFVYIGHEESGRKAMAPILDLNLQVTRLAVDPWNRLLANTFGGIIDTICKPDISRDLYSMDFKNYSASTYDAAFAKMDKFFAKNPDSRDAVLQLEFFPNQAMAAIDTDSSAFPWRDSTGYLNFIRYGKNNNATDSAAVAFGLEIRDDLAATSGYPELTTFVNYAHGDEKLERIYGKEKLPRLAELKKKWDPNQIFSFNNGLPTEYP